jgi:type II secretory pathway pseudopilin PulG
MFGKQSKRQSGFALLIFLVIMMGLGGIALTGVTQGFKKAVEKNTFEHNKRVLNEAKQALLMYAYNYPETAGRGPGRLPCPDMNISGTPNPPCPKSNPNIGRFPWEANGMNFYDIKDSSNESLWYAVSSTFDNGPSTTINSDSTGTITVFDQTGSLVYDGAADGIAAVIIVPGAAIARDEDNDGIYEYQQVRGTVPEQLDPRNYLDTFNDFDNGVFENALNVNVNGFILGPIRETDPNSPAKNSIVVNDQIVVITAAEVIEMAEKATLQAYRNAINTYRTNIQIDTPGFDAYPWLDDYTTTNLINYDAEVGVRLGRIPSIFASYFNNATATSQAITSDLTMLVENQLVNGFTIPSDERVISSATQIVFADGNLNVTPGLTPTGILLKRYFWDEITADGWQECLPVVVKTVQDCNQAASNFGVSNSAIVPNGVPMRIVRVTYTITIGVSTPFTRSYLGNAGNPVEYRAPTASEHAIAFFEFTDPVSISATISVGFEYDDNYDTVFTPTSPDNFNYKLGVRYYPVLPAWALEDDWHDSIQMAFSSGFQPGAAANCTPTDCLTVNNIAGVENDKQALLVLASEHGIDSSDGISQDELDAIFDEPHRQSDGDPGQDIFDNRSATDRILVIR